jgi:ABC-2 type transport system permease protein
MEAVTHSKVISHRPTVRRRGAAAIVLDRELRDLWLGGRGPLLLLAFSILLSVIAYLVATNQALNFLEQRESTNLLLQVAIAVGTLLCLVVAADSVSGERERATLESLLVTPVRRLDLVTGKLLAALSLWLATFAVAVPYTVFLGRDVGIAGPALVAGVVVGTLLAIFLASLGMLVSVFASSNRISLSVSLFVLLALFAPTQLPAPAQSGWAGDLLLRINPLAAGEHYIGKIVVNAHGWGDDASWLLSPAIGAALFCGLALLAGAKAMRLRGGTSE